LLAGPPQYQITGVNWIAGVLRECDRAKSTINGGNPNHRKLITVLHCFNSDLRAGLYPRI